MKEPTTAARLGSTISSGGRGSKLVYSRSGATLRTSVAIATTLLLCFFTHAADQPVGKSIAITKVKHSGAVDFENEILPILKNNCLACHNETKPKGGLVLETPQTILKGGDTGPAVVPKKPAESLLLKAASHQDEELIMPPRDNKVAAVALKPEELGLLQLWIEQGAKGEVRGMGPITWQPLPSGLSAIYAAALTRDGQFAACGRANQIFIYHVPSGQLAARLNDPRLQKSANIGAAHRDTVNSLAFSPDGELLASGGYRDVKLWRRVKPKFRIVDAGKVEAFASIGDGKWVATVNSNGDISFLGSDGRIAKTLAGRGVRPSSLRFTPDASRFAVAIHSTVEVWSVEQGRRIARTEISSPVTALAWAEANLAAGSDDGTIRVLAISTNGELRISREWKKTQSAIVALESTVANQLVSASADGFVRVWDLAADKSLFEAKHSGSITALAVRGDGKYLAAAGANSASLWNVSQTKPVTELKGDRRAVDVMAENERELTFAKSELDYRKGALKAAETNHTAVLARQKKATETNAVIAKVFAEKQAALTNAVAAQREAAKALDDFEPDVRKLVEIVLEEQKAAELAKATRMPVTNAVARSNALAEAKAALEKLPAEVKERQKAVTEKMTATAKSVADAEKELKKVELTKSTTDHELQLAAEALDKSTEVVATAKRALETTDADLKKAEAVLEQAQRRAVEAEKPVRSVAFSPDNLTLVTATSDGLLHTWSAETGAPFETIPAKATRALSFLQCGRVVCATDDGVAVADLNSTWVLERVIGSGDLDSPLIDRVNALRFTADGQRLITGGGEPSRGGEIKLWRVKDGTLVRELKNVHSDSVFALDVSPDGKYLASGAADRFAKVTELESGKVVKAFEGHTHHVLGVSWKRDGRTLLSAGADNIVKSWDFVAGERRKNIEGFAKEVTSISFVGIADQALATAGDGQVLLVKDKGDKVRSFTGATDYVYSAAATPDGRTVVAGGADGVLRVWNGGDGKLLAEFPAPSPVATTAAR